MISLCLTDCLKESYSGENWEVITEDEYNKRKNSEENSPFASLKDLDLDD